MGVMYAIDITRRECEGVGWRMAHGLDMPDIRSGCPSMPFTGRLRISPPRRSSGDNVDVVEGLLLLRGPNIRLEPAYCW